MNKKGLASIALVVLAFTFVAVYSISDISLVFNDPDYLGAVPGTLSTVLRDGTRRAAAYCDLKFLISILRQYEYFVAIALILSFFLLSLRDRRGAMADQDSIDLMAQSITVMATAIQKFVQT